MEWTIKFQSQYQCSPVPAVKVIRVAVTCSNGWLHDWAAHESSMTYTLNGNCILMSHRVLK